MLRAQLEWLSELRRREAADAAAVRHSSARPAPHARVYFDDGFSEGPTAANANAAASGARRHTVVRAAGARGAWRPARPGGSGDPAVDAGDALPYYTMRATGGPDSSGRRLCQHAPRCVYSVARAHPHRTFAPL
jgi:hypothetical protein